MRKLVQILFLITLMVSGIGISHAQVPPGIVPFNGIPILVPATLSEFQTMDYCRLTGGSWIPRDTSTCAALNIPSTHSTLTNFTNTPALQIFSSPTFDLNTCIPNINGLHLATFPSSADFVDWDTVAYGIPKVLRMGNTTPLEGTLSSNTGMTASYYFTPNEEQNLLVFWFSFVCTNPISGHHSFRNPLFRFELTDVNGNFITPNPMHSSFYILPKGTDPINNHCTHDLGDNQYTCYSTFYDGVFWSNWVRIAVDLSDFEGTTIRLRVLVSECQANFHRAYCYYTGFGTRASLDVQACQGDNIILKAPAGFIGYKWFINGNEQFNLTDVRVITLPRDNSYTTIRCDLTSVIGVTSSITANINYYDLFPDFTWEQKFTDCKNRVQFTDSSKIFMINNGGNVAQPTQYVNWDFGDGHTSTQINPLHEYEGTGPYDVRLTIWDADSICSIDTMYTITLQPSNNTTAAFQVSTCEEKLPYIFSDPLMGPNDHYSWSAEGTYTVTYLGAAWNGCDSVVSITLSIDKPQVRISQMQDYCENFSSELVAICNLPNVDFLWNTDETTESIIITKHGTYGVTITDENGCTAKTFIKILACDPPVYIPSAITPSDQNSQNDCIKIHSANLINSIDFTIYNRFGGIVYRTLDKNFVWCGEVQGKVPVNVIYQYVFIYIDDKGIERVKKGTITVL